MIHTLVHCLPTRAARRLLATTLCGGILLTHVTSCALFVQTLGAVAPEVKPAVYKKLAGQSVAVVVWAEQSGVRIDYPRINLDTAQLVQARLLRSQAEDKPTELVNTKFPVSAASGARFQEEHPELAAESMETIAPRFGVSRVIYIELRNFQTRSDASVDLFRGNVSGSVSVIEISNGVGHVAYTNDTIAVNFPKTSPEEGLPNIGDSAIYGGVLQGFADEVAKLFVPHGDDPDANYAVVSRSTDNQ